MQVGSDDHRDRRRLRRSEGTVAVTGGSRREPQPGDLALMAQTVEPARVVVLQASGDQLWLPRDGSGLEALELLDDRDHSGVACESTPWSDVLPAEQEPHEVLGGGRLDRFAP